MKMHNIIQHNVCVWLHDCQNRTTCKQECKSMLFVNLPEQISSKGQSQTQFANRYNQTTDNPQNNPLEKQHLKREGICDILTLLFALFINQVNGIDTQFFFFFFNKYEKYYKNICLNITGILYFVVIDCSNLLIYKMLIALSDYIFLNIIYIYTVKLYKKHRYSFKSLHLLYIHVS